MDLFSERSLPDDAKGYLTALEKKGRQPSTIKRYAYDLEDFYLWLRAGTDNIPWNSVSSKEIEKYLLYLKEQKQYAPRTIDRIWTVLKRFYAYFHELGVVKNNPAAMVVFDHDEINDRFSQGDFISKQEAEKLLRSIPSSAGLSENQQESRIYLAGRNLAMITLFLHYGPTLTELVALRMSDVHFESNEIDISSVSSISRTIRLKSNDMHLLFYYYHKIPQAVRPRRYSSDPLFAAFDFQRNTYRWDYSVDAPKALTEIAVQKMMRQEVQRAGLRKGISAQHLRRTCILRMLEQGEPPETVQTLTGLKTRLSLKRYFQFINYASA
ncbi:MAG TPA: tyrosine-type recombinase/integrase [Bacillales bacterium]